MKQITSNAAVMRFALASFAVGLVAMSPFAMASVPATASLPTEDATSYGYLRTVEGPGRVVQAASGAPIEIEANYPVLAGDRLEVDPGGRLELSLPDFNVVRLAGGSELLLSQLALSAETEDTETALRLLRGEIQFLVHDLLPVSERPRVDTANATIYLQSNGVYRIATDGYGWTEVVVRQGFAEVATEAGSSVVRGGEQAWIEGGRWPGVDVERAGGYDELERWGAGLDGELSDYSQTPVEDHLAYSAAPLSRHGSWVTDDGYRAWRPAVASDWRPYEAGYWADTPTGMVWVSSEPWAWVTYHYGSWTPSPSYGWVWRPGYRFAPAWVYWYWGPSYVAWVPVGYYSSHYGHYGRGFRFGVHGWAGGSWSYFADWTFCSTRNYRRRDVRHHVRRGRHLARDTRSYALERGLISTDSRYEARQQASRRGAIAGRGGESLPDVTAFVARRRDLSHEVSERVFSDRRAVSRDDVWESPRASRSIAGNSRSATSRGVSARVNSRDTIDAWRRESGRLRTGASRTGVSPTAVSPATGAAGPRARPVRPSGQATSGDRRWQDRSSPAAPRGRVPVTRESTRRGSVPSAGPRGQSDERPPVVRRVWEGIRDRQRAPSAQGPRQPATRPGSTPTRRAPATQSGSEPSRRAPAVQPRPAPRRDSPSAQRPTTQRPTAQRPSTQRPSTQRRSEPPRRSSTQRQSPPPRRQPAARSNGGGSSRRSSAAPGRRSSGGSSRSSAARRRPPAER